MQNRNTAAAVTFIRETRSSPPDIMWASAPDAFEVLKKDKLLHKYQPKAQGIADKVGTYPVNDPDGFFTGFAASGYGIMYNTRYLRANNLPAPKEWDDLKKPVYFGHVGISAPSRSGTTHLTVETILQGEGWDKGWATLLEIGGNLAQVSDRSFGVPDAVNSGQYGIGIVIDFFGLSAKASGFPVEFVYPTRDHDRAGQCRHHRQRQEPEGGRSLRRVPAVGGRPADPARSEDPAPAGAARDLRQGAGRLSQSVQGHDARRQGELQRRRVGGALRAAQLAVRPRRHVPPKELNAAWKAIHDAEKQARRRARKRRRPSSCSREARKLATVGAVTEKEASDKAIAARSRRSSRARRPPAARPSSRRNGTPFAVKNYAEAKALAEKALTAK